jgi:hypothetical protein
MRWPIKNGKNLSHEFQNLAFYFNVSSFYGYICCSYFKIFRYILTSKPELKCIKRLYVYALLDLTCDLMIYKKSSQVKSFLTWVKSGQVKSSHFWLESNRVKSSQVIFDLTQIRSSQVILFRKIFQVKSSEVKWLVTWLDLI